MLNEIAPEKGKSFLARKQVKREARARMKNGKKIGKNSRDIMLLGQMEITKNGPDPNCLSAFEKRFLESILKISKIIP